MGLFRFYISRYFAAEKRINPARRITLGFLLIILIGALLLMLPISSKERNVTPFLTALFTTTSATCVTGLTLVDTGSYYSVFGQAVILLLIQFGGLGFMTIFTVAFVAANKRIGLRSRMMIAQSFGLESVEGVVGLTRRVVRATVLFEGVGALILAFRFVPQFGFLKGIWYAVFHSASAFCNAGFDILGNGDSIAAYQSDPLVILTLSALIIIGGLGFVVWEDVANARRTGRLSMYTRLVFIITALLLVLGAVGFFVFESGGVLKEQSTGVKILSSFFQSVTTRTAGFASIEQTNLSEQSKLLTIALMMIGGASGSTAGGVKIATVGVAFLTVRAVLSSKDEVIIFGRRIRQSNSLYALSLVFLWVVLVTAASAFISVFDRLPLIDTFYEIASAYGTAGLTAGVTAAASLPSRLLLILYMFFGRIGIMTIGVSFTTRSKNKEIGYPDGNILIG